MIPKTWNGIKILADMNCTCTINQQNSKDYTLCKTCESASILNYIEDLKRDFVKEIFGEVNII